MTNINNSEHPVVVGVDGSESALHAVRWAAREAERRGALLRLVHVCVLTPVRHPRQVAPPPASAPVVVALDEAAVSQAARLVVVGRRGRGGFRDLVLGSTSQQLLHHATCPVAVVCTETTE